MHYKHIIRLSIPCLELLLSLAPKYTVADDLVINTKSLGPFIRYDQSYIYSTISWYGHGSKAFNYKILGSCDEFKDRVMYMSQFITYKENETKYFTLKIDNNYLLDTGFTYSFCTYNSNNSLRKRIDLTLYPNTCQSVSLNKDKNTYFDFKCYKAMIQDNHVKELGRDIMSFRYLPETLLSNTYLDLPVENLNMMWFGVQEFECKEIFISFVDFYNHYPLLHLNTFTPLVNIYLKPKINQAMITFELANQMYVNPKTLDMSFRYKQDYIATKHFFFPKNGKQNIINYKFVFNLKGLGGSNSNISKSLNYSYLKGLIGSCANNDFCVIGGVDNG